MVDLNVLAQRFRPYLKFSHYHNDEHYRPCSWQWIYERSTLHDQIGEERIGNNYSKVLRDSDIKVSGFNKDANIKIDNNAEGGDSWQAAVEGNGIYCHASKVNYWGKSSSTDTQFINLEYWLLFGYNRCHNVADHKGDVVCVHAVYSLNEDRICRVTFGIHGSAIIAFDIPMWNSGYKWFDGIDIDGQKISTYNMKVKIPENYQYQFGSSIPTPGGFYDLDFSSSTPNLFFAYDETTKKYEHIVVFLEHGSHEAWPNKTGGYKFAPNHRGTSYSFLPKKVNLLDRSTDSPFYYFGGKFGDPKGLMRHRTWFLEYDDPQVSDAIRTDMSPYEDLGPVKWPPLLGDYLGNKNTMEVHSLREAK
jgi:hypothetical protein